MSLHLVIIQLQKKMKHTILHLVRLIYYGRMNLMQFSNLIDYSLFANLTIDEKLKTKFEYHRFYADRPANKWLSYTIANVQSDHYGDEIDLVTTYKQSKNLSFQLGLGYFLTVAI